MYNCTQERRGNLCTGRLSWAIDSVCNCTESKIRAQSSIGSVCRSVSPQFRFSSHMKMRPLLRPFFVLATGVSTFVEAAIADGSVCNYTPPRKGKQFHSLKTNRIGLGLLRTFEDHGSGPVSWTTNTPTYYERRFLKNFIAVLMVRLSHEDLRQESESLI